VEVVVRRRPESVPNRQGSLLEPDLPPPPVLAPAATRPEPKPLLNARPWPPPPARPPGPGEAGIGSPD